MSHAQSRQLAARDKPPPASHPYLRCGKWRRGWCSEGGRGTGGNGKNISSSSPMLADGWRALRCGLHIRTAAATASQRGTRRGCGRGERLSVRGAGGYDSITFFAGRQRKQKAGSWLRGGKLRAGSGEGNSARCQRLSASVSVVQSGCRSLSEGRTGGLLRPLTGGEVRVCVVCRCKHPPPLVCLCDNLLEQKKRASTDHHDKVIKIIVLFQWLLQLKIQPH